MINSEQQDHGHVELGLPRLRSPWRNRTRYTKWKRVPLPPPATGTATKPCQESELPLTELQPFGPGCREIPVGGSTADGEMRAARLCSATLCLAELISGRGERELIILHWQVMVLCFWLIVLMKVMSGCSSDYLSPNHRAALYDNEKLVALLSNAPFFTFPYPHLCQLLSQNNYWWIDFCWTDSAACRTEPQAVAVLAPKSSWAFSGSEPPQVSRLGGAAPTPESPLQSCMAFASCVAWSAFFDGCYSL